MKNLYKRRCRLLGQFHSHRDLLAPNIFLLRSPYTETKFIGIRMGKRYKQESVENLMKGDPCIVKLAPNSE